MTLQGSTKDFPLEAVIGLLATSSKTGELQIRGADQIGALGFANGRLVAAVCGDHGGEDALGAIFSIREAAFEFTPWTEAPEGNLEGDLDSLLRRAAESRDRLASIRAVIPDDRMRFRLSERAADQGAVTFTPERWRALLAVNGERDVAAIAQHLGIGKMDALNLLAGLVRDGVIEALAAPAEAAPTATFAPPPLATPATFGAPASASPPQAASPQTATPQAPPPAPDWMTAPGPAAPEWLPRAPTGEWTAPAPAEPAPVEPIPAAHAWPEAPAAAEPEPAPAPQWAAPAAPPEWTKPSSQWAPATPDATAAPAAATATDWSASTPPAPPKQDGRTERADPGESTDQEMPAAPSQADDRLSALSGIFTPPSEQTPPPAPAASWSAPATAPDSWSASTTASTSAPPESASRAASTWAEAGRDAPASANQWAPDAPSVTAPPGLSGEWAPPASAPAAPAEKKKGGLFGMFARERTTAVPAAAQEPIAGSTRLGALAAFSNALIAEFNSGKYGKTRIEERMANLLMRVDEQADPIDRPLPIVDDRIDVEALERESLDDAQAAPYLASIARQIFEDAEKAFGKDKAKKGYKVAQQRIFLGDISVLHAPDIAGKLPKV